jgi:hypothetical protein
LFSAYTVDNRSVAKLALDRFRREFLVAFNACRAAQRESNPRAQEAGLHAPATPT